MDQTQSKMEPLPFERASLADDPYLKPFRQNIEERKRRVTRTLERITGNRVGLGDFASAHEFYGLHFRDNQWIFRELAPNATAIWLIGTFSNWERNDTFRLERIEDRGVWALALPADALAHGDLYRLSMDWDGGGGERIPAYVRRAVQDEHTHLFSAQVWQPDPYVWLHETPAPDGEAPLIYEAHVGMAVEHEGVGTFNAFRERVLPRIKAAGYTVVQLMAILEHPYYGSFGYQISNFFAPSSRYGTPEEFKQLVDAAHGMGLRVIIDMIHSHAVKNEAEGLSLFDGTPYLYFHGGSRGWHPAWDSRCFDYGKTDVLHFLLSNCRYWVDEFNLDGFRFDGITSMLYLHHGLGVNFVDYAQYFDDMFDANAWVYLSLANQLLHDIKPSIITVAEDMSGMPGLAAPLQEGGAGFDFRMAMGVPDCWFKLLRDVRDEDWALGYLWHELTNRRDDECTINYVECHDQAIVGGKTLLFEMMDAAIYDSMEVGSRSLAADRAVALHKMIRLATLGTAGHGYLNFMGNEFGHPEWVDFPREGNDFSYKHARRQWSLRDDKSLRFHGLAEFDRDMISTFDRHISLKASKPERLWLHNDDKVLAYRRGKLIVILALHSSQSFTDYPVPLPAGSYKLLLTTDDERYSGQQRIAPDQRFFTRKTEINDKATDAITLYLPCRTGLLLLAEEKHALAGNVCPD